MATMSGQGGNTGELNAGSSNNGAIETSGLKSLIDSELFAVLAWKNKRRTLKYFSLALIACLLNSVWKVSCTVLILLAVLILRGPIIALNLIKARRLQAKQAAEGSDQMDDGSQATKEEASSGNANSENGGTAMTNDLELVSEEHLA